MTQKPRPTDKVIKRLLFMAELKEPQDLNFVECLLEDIYSQVDFCVEKLSLLGPQLTLPNPSQRKPKGDAKA